MSHLTCLHRHRVSHDDIHHRTSKHTRVKANHFPVFFIVGRKADLELKKYTFQPSTSPEGSIIDTSSPSTPLDLSKCSANNKSQSKNGKSTKPSASSLNLPSIVTSCPFKPNLALPSTSSLEYKHKKWQMKGASSSSLGVNTLSNGSEATSSLHPLLPLILSAKNLSSALSSSAAGGISGSSILLASTKKRKFNSTTDDDDQFDDRPSLVLNELQDSLDSSNGKSDFLERSQLSYLLRLFSR